MSFYYKTLVFGLSPLFLSANGFAFRGTMLEPPSCAAGSQATVTPPQASEAPGTENQPNYILSYPQIKPQPLDCGFYICEMICCFSSLVT